MRSDMTAHAAPPCPHCAAHPEFAHADWHPTRDQLLSIGREMARRRTAADSWETRALDDGPLAGYIARLRRIIGAADEDGLPDFLVDLARGWLADAEKEWGWRKRASMPGEMEHRVVQGKWVERLEVIRREVDLAMLIAYENAGARPSGPGKWTCCCPFHEDRHPSLDIDVAKGVWLCRACNTGGDAFDYVRERYGLGFKQAVEHLEARLGIEPAKAVRTLRGISVDD
jgi:hypothetical protein